MEFVFETPRGSYRVEVQFMRRLPRIVLIGPVGLARVAFEERAEAIKLADALPHRRTIVTVIPRDVETMALANYGAELADALLREVQAAPVDVPGSL